MIFFGKMTGGELLNLQWKEVEKNRIKITSTEDWKVKNRKDAWVPISPKLRMEMSDWDKSGEIWVLDTGNQQKYWSHLNELTASMRFVQNKCECRGPKPLHGFRAGVATEFHHAAADVASLRGRVEKLRSESTLWESTNRERAL